MITKPFTAPNPNGYYAVQTMYSTITSEDVVSLEKAISQYKALVAYIGNYPPSDPVVNIPWIVEVEGYVPVEKVTFTPQLRKRKRKIVAAPAKMERYDRDTVSEYEVVIGPLAPATSKLPCMLCRASTDEITATHGSLLSYFVKSQPYTEYDSINMVEVEFQRKIKIPTYKAGVVCRDCVGEFTRLCSSYDSKRNVKAKLKYVAPPKESSIADDLVLPIDTIKDFRDVEVPEDQVAEYDYPTRILERKLTFTADPLPDSPLEIAERRTKAKKQRPEVQNVKEKFSRRPRRYKTI